MHIDVTYPRSDRSRWKRAVKDANDYNPKVAKVLREWLPKDWSNTKSIRQRAVLLRSARLAAAFGGIQGFPVTALIRMILAEGWCVYRTSDLAGDQSASDSTR